MTDQQTYLTLFYILFDYFKEDPTCTETWHEDLASYLSDMQPFLFKDTLSADPAEYADFEEVWQREAQQDELAPEAAREVALHFLSGQFLQSAMDMALAYVTPERWEAKAQEIGARFPHPLPNR